jgi:hypothetical protein
MSKLLKSGYKVVATLDSGFRILHRVDEPKTAHGKHIRYHFRIEPIAAPGKKLKKAYIGRALTWRRRVDVMFLRPRP